MAQGTEADDAPAATWWGFAQAEWMDTFDARPMVAGAWSGQDAQFNLIAPDNRRESELQVRRARLGLRGRINGKLNYSLLGEAGKNSITQPNGRNPSPELIDASLTLSVIPGMRVRLGQFKHPGVEEGMTAAHLAEYNNFSSITGQQIQERFFDADGSIACSPELNARRDCTNRLNGPVSAFRDIGVQLFDTRKHGDWEVFYALMVGNGNGLNRTDNDDNKDLYAYLSGERIFAGKGPLRDGWKVFAWMQDGKRELEYPVRRDFDRERRGVGTTWRRDGWRLIAEYIQADGMIFTGTDGSAPAGALDNSGLVLASNNLAPEEKADGWYVDLGRRISPLVELDLRYDTQNRATRDALAERKFENWTVGVKFLFNPRLRLRVNYEFRDIRAPHLAADSAANRNFEGIGDRLGVQVEYKF